MGRDWERRANKIEKRRAWKRSNKVMNEKEKRRKQRRQKTKEDMILTELQEIKRQLGNELYQSKKSLESEKRRWRVKNDI